jgi:uncharacterized protein
MLQISTDPPLTLMAAPAALTSSRALIVADVHLGKSATFRAKGLPVPEGDNEHDLGRLLECIARTEATRLVVAGDLIHAPAGKTTATLSAIESFLEACRIPVTLVLGNHDRNSGALPRDWNLEIVPALDLDGWHIVHDPADAPKDRASIAGHWHPAIRIPDGKRTSLRLPCFWLRGKNLVLPSFGSFTGGQVVTPLEGHRIFSVLRDQVVELPQALWKP